MQIHDCRMQIIYSFNNRKFCFHIFLHFKIKRSNSPKKPTNKYIQVYRFLM